MVIVQDELEKRQGDLKKNVLKILFKKKKFGFASSSFCVPVPKVWFG